MLASTEQELLLQGAGPDDGRSTLMNSYRSELGELIAVLYWTVRDFYTLGDEFAYIALVQKADKKIKTFAFDIGNHLHNCMHYGPFCSHLGFARIYMERSPRRTSLGVDILGVPATAHVENTRK
jgi:hypothetical protein